jgi:hypothetical protein
VQKSVVVELIASGLTDAQLFTAYLGGGAAAIIGAYVAIHCRGSWAEVRQRCESGDYAAARALLESR